VLSFLSEAREVSGSETARVDLAAYRRHGFRPDVERQLTDGRRPMQFILIVVTIAAADGERDPDELCARALKALGFNIRLIAGSGAS
jgi:hypothetical protein